MMSAIKSEFRKLLTTRSTYVLAVLSALVLVLISFYIHGYKAESFTDRGFIPPNLLTSATMASVQAISLFMALIGVLLVTHEYRYNTIMYSLMAARRRWYIPAAKIIAVSTVVVALALVFSALAPVLTRFGAQLAGTELPAQDFAMGQMILKSIFFIWASAMFGLIIALLIRSQVGTIVTLLLFQGVVETLILGLLLKENAKYLPFTALDQFMLPVQAGTATLSNMQSALITLGYIVVGAGVAFVLFQKRDAN